MSYWDDVTTGRRTANTTSKISKIKTYSTPRAAPLSSYKAASERLGRRAQAAGINDWDNTDPRNVNWYAAARGALPSTPSTRKSSSGGSGGSRYRRYGGGGGGGGGGAAGLTAEQMAAYQRLISNGPTLQEFTKFQSPKFKRFTPEAMPEYEMFTPGPRDTAVYDDAMRRINSARSADYARAMRLFNALDSQLAGQGNAFDDARMIRNPQIAQAYQSIVGDQAANSMVADAMAEEAAYGEGMDNTFGDLMAVLAAQEGRNMQSRAREARQNRTAVGTGIDARAAGMRGGVEMANLQDAREYQRYLEDVARMENATRQEWARANQQYLNEIGYAETQAARERAYQQALANWQGRLSTNTANTGIRNDWLGEMLGLIPTLSGSEASTALAQIGA